MLNRPGVESGLIGPGDSFRHRQRLLLLPFGWRGFAGHFFPIRHGETKAGEDLLVGNGSVAGSKPSVGLGDFFALGVAQGVPPRRPREE